MPRLPYFAISFLAQTLIAFYCKVGILALFALRFAWRFYSFYNGKVLPQLGGGFEERSDVRRYDERGG
jgi:hypothetical protein